MLHSFENNAPVPEVFAILSFFILFCKFLWATLYGFVLARAVGVPVGRCSPKNLGGDHFPDTVGHFWAPWWPFWIFEVPIEGIIESKNLFSESCSGGPITKDLGYFQTLLAILN